MEQQHHGSLNRVSRRHICPGEKHKNVSSKSDRWLHMCIRFLRIWIIDAGLRRVWLDRTWRCGAMRKGVLTNSSIYYYYYYCTYNCILLYWINCINVISIPVRGERYDWPMAAFFTCWRVAAPDWLINACYVYGGNTMIGCTALSNREIYR